jgi:L-amino acid N-acyltransferase
MRADDVARVNEIYNWYVLHSTCTYQVDRETVADRAAWFASHGDGHPLTVAEVGGTVVGWASLSPFHSRCGYRLTVENSVYVDRAWHRRGVGSALLADLIARARALGHHTIIAGIDSAQDGSIALHARAGFTRVAHLVEVGRKFDRWLDVVYMQLTL